MSCRRGRSGARTDRRRAVGLGRPEAIPQSAPAGCFPDCVPDVALVDVDLSGLREVKAFWPSVAVVSDAIYYASDSVATNPIFAAVEDVLASDVPEDDCSFEALLQPSHIVNRNAGFAEPPLRIL